MDSRHPSRADMSPFANSIGESAWGNSGPWVSVALSSSPDIVIMWRKLPGI